MRLCALCTLFVSVLFIPFGFSQEVRAADGTGNNLAHPEWGATGSELLRLGPVTYGDGISSPAGVDLPNPRVLSNIFFEQEESIPDPEGHSDFLWVFGFLDTPC